ncbi:hypothetical protein [Pseudoalteromonas sp. S16_S37]|uniref:hypothetical protein n=1 Tax=Pseudoalteromonas sp. S16_S37 TaxID=2720228 RepID=UPI0016813CD6|nr:hypothetical protein [Pseudoalteromonas sp. S16_S37]MBD1581224.1 hypothetical protein [Pseudoalteromonas sp. S16_S37]
MSWFNWLHRALDNNGPSPAPKKNDSERYSYFNTTGTMLVTSICPPTQSLPAETQRIFNQSAAFLATAMRAISTTTNPHTGQPYSIFNHFALTRVLTGSGRFAKLSEEILMIPNDVFCEDDHCGLFSTLFSMDFSKHSLPFAKALTTEFANNACDMATRSHPAESKTAHLVLSCEHLYGLANVNVILFTLDNQVHSEHLAKRPCLHKGHTLPDWQIAKEQFIYTSSPPKSSSI